MSIDDAIDDARDKATEFLNIQGRSPGHVVAGVLLTAGFAFLATGAANSLLRPNPRTARQLAHHKGPITERPRGPLSLVLPAVFSATTLSALRVWNAPPRPERTTAMALWGVAQAVNAVWLALRPSSRGLQIAAAMSSAGLAAAFAHEARKLDTGAGKLAAPTGIGVRIANAMGRKVDDRPTVH
ncbi:MAG: TspO protein [Brevundimonas sp.]|uniref:tryptophan-rich sensory protein n=1 Tax=Brevundimonas sp. TaxID=1871086 RepID=UPI0012188789|nr:tryptophan-rich sensory protein [Brevundimonas sp.]RZJ19498.1 MAG: TspO protein [Brevundimonas sp.]